MRMGICRPAPQEHAGKHATMRTLQNAHLDSLAETVIDLEHGPLVAPAVIIPPILELPVNTFNELNLGE